VLREAAFGARKADKVIDFVRLRFDEEIQFLRRIALETQALRDLVALAWIIHEHLDVLATGSTGFLLL
jgi:hypothetical protein